MNPLVALYFACNDEDQRSKNGVVIYLTFKKADLNSQIAIQ
ncbi:hypothetical protein ACTACD_28395 [Pseudomonas syringae]